MRRLWPVVVVSVAACGPSGTGGVAATASPTPSAQASSEAHVVPATSERLADAGCQPAIVVEGGREGASLCAAEARARGLTVVELADAWTPTLFAPRADGSAPAFRATYLELAAERAAGDDLNGLGELYGVVPSLAVVRMRLADRARHACRAAVDTAPIAGLVKPYGQDHGPLVRGWDGARRALAARFERERVRRKLATLDATLDVLAAVPAQAATVARYRQLAAQHTGLRAAQAVLVCERFLAPAFAEGQLGWQAGLAIEKFQRRNFLMPNQRLDPETRDAMQVASPELDFRLALRVLRERVVDASGLLEDGTASGGPQPILGRLLDPAPMRAARGREAPLPNGAPDLVGAATEAAARQLGWAGPDEVHAFLARHPGGVRVALALPALPAYHAPHMDLRAEIDRGDVWYDDVPIRRMIRHRPTLVLSVDDAGTRRPLVRWPTTIGGWSDVRRPDGRVEQKWKESDVGPRVWRDLYAAPTWLPPPSTPDRDLVKNLYNGRWDLKRSVMGPGPHAAFGLVLLTHLAQGPRGQLRDNGIGTHGSSTVTSIVHGTSHGCHRLYNQLAVRLANFLLRHRTHEVRGAQKVAYRRIVRHRGTFSAKVDTRGYLFQLTPPVPVDVTAGTIRSPRKIPPRNAVAATQ